MGWHGGMGVNRVSGRRGDLDFVLQDGGNGTLPPPPCPRVDPSPWGKAKLAMTVLGSQTKAG